MPTKEIYSSLNVRQFKNLLDLVDSDENKVDYLNFTAEKTNPNSHAFVSINGSSFGEYFVTKSIFDKGLVICMQQLTGI